MDWFSETQLAELLRLVSLDIKTRADNVSRESSKTALISHVQAVRTALELVAVLMKRRSLVLSPGSSQEFQKPSCV